MKFGDLFQIKIGESFSDTMIYNLKSTKTTLSDIIKEQVKNIANNELDSARILAQWLLQAGPQEFAFHTIGLSAEWHNSNFSITPLKNYQDSLLTKTLLGSEENNPNSILAKWDMTKFNGWTLLGEIYDGQLISN
jgi:hypothetical protein